MAERIKERHRREQEMYKCIEQRDKYQKNNDARYTASEQRVSANTQAYEDLNHEIIEDIPKLIADSEQFFQPLIFQLILNQAQFWNAMTQHANALGSTVDPALAYTPQINPVITNKQVSSLTKKYAQQSNPWGTDISKPGGGSNPWGTPDPEPGYAAPAPAPNPFGAPVGGAPQPLPPRPTRTPAAPPAVQARGMWDFNASEATELSFRSGDILHVIEQNGEWWVAELNGKRGQVPANYVQLI